MLNLLKYEWKACARVCLPVYGGVLLAAVINYLLASAAPAGSAEKFFAIVQVLGVLVYTGLIVAVFVVTLVLLLQRFYKNLLGDEGYLMFTLPVTVSQHIWAKTLVATAMSVLSVAAALLSGLVLARGWKGLAAPFQTMGRLFGSAGANEMLYGAEGLVFLLVGGMSCILFLYLCIAMGHLAKKHRVAMSVVWFFVLSTAAQLVLMLVLFGAGGEMLPIMRTISGWVNGLDERTVMHLFMACSIAAAAVPGALCFFGTRHILRTRLNLE